MHGIDYDMPLRCGRCTHEQHSIDPLFLFLFENNNIRSGRRKKKENWPECFSFAPHDTGSLTVNCGNVLQDCNHEGHGGWRIDTMANALPQFLPLPATTSTDPDVILLMLGTNDMGQNFFVETAPQRLVDLIVDIRNRLA